MLRQIIANRLLIREVGNITHHAGYKDLWLGHAWSYLEPLMYAVAFYMFVRLVRGGAAGSADALILTILSGQAVYDWFSKTICGSPGTLEKFQGILLTMRISPLLLLSADFYYFFKSSFTRFILLGGAMLLFGVPPSFSWLLILPVMFLIAVFLFPLGVILGIIGVYVRDIGHLMATVSRLGIFVTPILFSLRGVHSKLAYVLEANPIAQLIELVRTVLIYKSVPNWIGVFYVLIFSAALWFIASVCLNKFGPQLAKEI
jgi:ABC-type polysaccharide/polyol phosphate export permease